MKVIAKVLVIVGGINWGLVGVGMLLGKDWNLVHLILGFSMTVEAIVYLLVGIAAIGLIFKCKCHNNCKEGCCAGDMKQEAAPMTQ